MQSPWISLPTDNPWSNHPSSNLQFNPFLVPQLQKLFGPIRTYIPFIRPFLQSPISFSLSLKFLVPFLQTPFAHAFYSPALSCLLVLTWQTLNSAYTQPLTCPAPVLSHCSVWLEKFLTSNSWHQTPGRPLVLLGNHTTFPWSTKSPGHLFLALVSPSPPPCSTIDLASHFTEKTKQSGNGICKLPHWVSWFVPFLGPGSLTSLLCP